jgi:hypothetical protein
MTRSTKISGVLACFVGLVAVAFPADAFAIDWGVKLEPGMAAAAADPQARLFGPGGSEIEISRYRPLCIRRSFVGCSSLSEVPSTCLAHPA